MSSTLVRTPLGVLAVLLALAVACRDKDEQQRIAPTPPSVIRAGELYPCSNGVEGCRVTYEIGRVTRIADRLRIEFLVTLDGPSGGTTDWTNDMQMHDQLEGEGQAGIGLALVADRSVFYELIDAGGIAASNVTLVAPVTYQGFWVFHVSEPPGTELLLRYPDFIDRPVPITVPD